MRMAKVVTPLVAALLAVVPAVQAQTVKATFNYPVGITGVAINYLTNRAYVLLPAYNADGTSAVQVLDGWKNTVLATYTVPVASAIAVNVLTGTVYVAGPEASATNASGIESVVVAINPATGAIEETIPVTATSGFGIVSLAADPLHHKLFVANDSDNVIDVINTKKNAIETTVALNGQTPNTVAVNILSGEAFATLNDNQVAIIKGDCSVTFTQYGAQTSGIAVNPITDHEFVTDGVFDTPTVGKLGRNGATDSSAAVGLFPQGVDVDYKYNLVFVANEADGTISEVSGKTLEVLSTIPIAANTIAVNSISGTVYASASTTLTIFAEK